MDILRFRNFPRFRNSDSETPRIQETPGCPDSETPVCPDSETPGFPRFRNSRLPRFRNPYMQYQSSMQILPFQRVLVTIASHFLNLIIIFKNFPPPKPYMQWYSSMHIPPFDRVLVTMASHFLNFPPQSPTCNGIPQCKSLPLIESLSRLQVIF